MDKITWVLKYHSFWHMAETLTETGNTSPICSACPCSVKSVFGLKL